MCVFSGRCRKGKYFSEGADGVGGLTYIFYPTMPLEQPAMRSHKGSASQACQDAAISQFINEVPISSLTKC